MGGEDAGRVDVVEEVPKVRRTDFDVQYIYIDIYI